MVADDLEMNWQLDHFDEFLDRSGSMRVSADFECVLFEALEHHGELVIGAVFNEFLDKVVAKAIHHQLVRLHHRTLENMIKHFLVLFICHQQYLLLKEATSSLIFGQARGVLEHLKLVLPGKSSVAFECVV